MNTLDNINVMVTDNGLYILEAVYDELNDDGTYFIKTLALTPNELMKWLGDNLPHKPKPDMKVVN